MREDQLKLVKRAPVIATITSLFLAFLKFFTGLFSWSISLLSSAIDSILDSLVSLFNYFAIKFSLKPADKWHPYWHWKIEGIAVSLEGIIIMLSSFYIIYESINKIIYPEEVEYIGFIMSTMLISVVLTWILTIYLKSVYKKTTNLVISWDIVHYKMDLYINISILIVFLLLYLYPSLVFIDWILWLLIWIYIVYESYKLISRGINLLLDTKLKEHSEVKKILDNYLKNKEFESYHFLKTRSGWANSKFVEFHFVMDPKTTILEAHKLWDKIEEDIKKIDKSSFWHVLWHADPYDDSLSDKVI